MSTKNNQGRRKKPLKVSLVKSMSRDFFDVKPTNAFNDYSKTLKARERYEELMDDATEEELGDYFNILVTKTGSKLF